MKAFILTWGILLAMFLGISCASIRKPEPPMIDEKKLDISVLGPFNRDEIRVEVLTRLKPSILTKDVFHFAILDAIPGDARFTWFRIARASSDENSWFLVAGPAKDGGCWAEKGILAYNDATGHYHFTIERENNGEGTFGKTIREFEWEKKNPRQIQITIKEYQRYVLNPVWGAPSETRIKIEVKA